MKKLLFNEKTLDILFCISAFAFIYMQAVVFNSVDMDYWARLLQGNAFLDTGHILETDPFSYTQTHLWLDHEWGSSVIFAVVQKAGYSFVLLFKSLLVFLTFFFTYKALKLNNENTNILFDIVYFVFAALAMPTVTQSWLRCHFFTFLFFTFSLFLLEKVRKSQNFKLLVILPVLMLFWSNMHGGCVALLGICVIYAAGECLNKKPFKYYLLTVLACFAVMFINPYGIEYVKFIFMAVAMERPFVTEWISPFAHPAWNFLIEFKILYISNFALLLFSLRKIKSDYTKYFLLIVCTYLSFRYVKNTPFFIIVSIIFLYGNLLCAIEKICEKFKLYFDVKILSIIFCSGIFVFSVYNIGMNIISVSLPDLSLQPVKVVEFIKNNELSGNILAPFDMGSYIVYKLYPQNLIYMDGRYEEVYYNETKELADKFYNTAKDWDKILESGLMHDYIIIPYDALINDYMEKRADYGLIYSDINNNLYARKDLIKESYKMPNYKFSYRLWSEAFSTEVKIIE